MRIVFVHGWSVTNTNTYGGLPAALVANAKSVGLKLQVSHLYLAKYVSFSDEVKVDDIARGMEHAMREEIIPLLKGKEPLACITHSTGGPVVREWIHQFYGTLLKKCPLTHLIMLAPANHGSALAQLGKGKLSRLKTFVVDGVQPGVGVLEWLELGSAQSWALNLAWLNYDCVNSGLYPFVLTGQKIDRAFYDNLNSYTGEAGSDGVVRAAAANMNFSLLRLAQIDGKFSLTTQLHAPAAAFGILPQQAHSGADLGIMRSVKASDDGSHPTVKWILRCLQVSTAKSYQAVTEELAAVTAKTQIDEKIETVKTGFIFERTFTTSRYTMLVFSLTDDRGNTLNDYEVLFTAGPDYDPNHLPPGFFRDRQRNQLHPGKLTYYVDYDVLADWFAKPEVGTNFGIRIVVRPGDGYAFYTIAEHRDSFANLKQFLAPNETVMVEVQLKRHVREGVFRLTQKLTADNFSKQPKGDELPPNL